MFFGFSRSAAFLFCQIAQGKPDSFHTPAIQGKWRVFAFLFSGTHQILNSRFEFRKIVQVLQKSILNLRTGILGFRAGVAGKDLLLQGDLKQENRQMISDNKLKGKSCTSKVGLLEGLSWQAVPGLYE